MKERKKSGLRSGKWKAAAANRLIAIWRNKQIIPILLSGVLLVTIILFVTFILPLPGIVRSAGQKAGKVGGVITGVVVGSAEGVASGLPKGAEAGREAGLGAGDTVAELSNAIERNVRSIGKLEVLVANVDRTDFHEVGDKYAALRLCRARAVFTVDLSEITVTHEGKSITVTYPKPSVKVDYDPSQTELLAEYQRKYFNGSDEDGFIAKLNSSVAADQVSTEKLNNYGALEEMASRYAEDQIRKIGEAVRGGDSKIEVVPQMKTE